MAVRWTTIVVGGLACWLGWASGTARADWGVHRSPADLTRRWTHDLVAQPEDARLAERIARRLGPSALSAVIDELGRRADAAPSDTRAELAAAQLLLAGGHWSDAAIRFARAAVLAPDTFAPRWGHARAVRHLGDDHAAVRELRAALAAARRPEDVALVARELAIASSTIGDADAEVAARRALAQAMPGDLAARFDLAAALARAGRPAEAAVALAAASELRLSTAERLRWALTEARDRLDAGDLAGASAVLDAAFAGAGRATDDQRREVWDLAIEAARRRGDLESLKARVARPHDRAEWVARARIAQEQGDLSDARAALETAIRLSPHDLDLQRARIAIVKRIGRTDDVVSAYERLAAAASSLDGAEALRAVVEALDETWRLGRRDVAGGIFDRALGRARHDPIALHALGEAAGRSADDRRAVAAWTVALARDPHDEVAVVALGEAQFQRGQRRAARETWRALLRSDGFSAAAHVRVGELLLEHDLDDDALGEAHAAIAAAPNSPGPHGLMARLFERSRRLREAEDEWETVLRVAAGPNGVAERRAARGRLIVLWSRQGGAYVDARLGDLERSIRDDGDREPVELLVEAQLRLGRTDDAIATLERFLATHRGAGVAGASGDRSGGDRSVRDRDVADGDRDADLILLMVRTLRQAHRTAEATAWLQRLAAASPARARDANLQLAEIALGEHADARAGELARQAVAASPNDTRVLLRVAAIEERLGHLDDALAITARASDAGHRGDDAEARLAYATLLARVGRVDEQRTVLRQVLRDARDDEIIAAAGHDLFVIEEGAGTLDELETFVAELPEPAGPSVARGKLLVAILDRLVPGAYRTRATDGRAAFALAGFARHALRPLLDAAGGPDSEPDPAAIAILGMLGRTESVPVLARLVAPDLDADPDRGARPQPSTSPAFSDDVVQAAVIALGRLGGDGARTALERASAASLLSPRPALTTSIIWALGRVGGAVAMTRAHAEIARGATDASAFGCFALGRSGGRDAAPTLVVVIRDSARPMVVRRAAALGLGVGGADDTTEVLLEAMDGGDPELVATAGVALGLAGRRTHGDARRTLMEALQSRAASAADHDATAGGNRATRAASARTAWHVMESDAPPPEESVEIAGGRIDLDAFLRSIEDGARAIADASASDAAASAQPASVASDEAMCDTVLHRPAP